jgi:hypothetical protein
MPTIESLQQPLTQGGPQRGGNVGIIREFLDFSIPLLFGHRSSHPCEKSPLKIHYDGRGPHVDYGGCPSGFNIRLTAQNDFWIQHAYQFAHELCHIYAQCYRNEGEYGHAIFPNQWFEEAVCEAASLYCLRRIVLARENGPCRDYTANGKMYYECVQNYLDACLNSPDRDSPADWRQWRADHESRLRSDPYCRSRVNGLGNKLYTLFDTDQSLWAAVGYLNERPCDPNADSFSDYLKNWRLATPATSAGLIDQVENLFL